MVMSLANAATRRSFALGDCGEALGIVESVYATYRPGIRSLVWLAAGSESNRGMSAASSRRSGHYQKKATTERCQRDHDTAKPHSNALNAMCPRRRKSHQAVKPAYE